MIFDVFSIHVYISLCQPMEIPNNLAYDDQDSLELLQAWCFSYQSK